MTTKWSEVDCPVKEILKQTERLIVILEKALDHCEECHRVSKEGTVEVEKIVAR